jgi:hypothetical protein
MIEVLSRQQYYSNPTMYHQGGTILSVVIPPGTRINLLNLLEAVSPTGISLIVRIPILGGRRIYQRLVREVESLGGTVSAVDQGEEARYY